MRPRVTKSNHSTMSRVEVERPGIRRMPDVVKCWVYRFVITVLLVTNVWSRPDLFLPAVSYRKIIYGYSLFTLPDGTEGAVLAGGTVSYIPNFSQLYHEYSATGDAFFQVRRTDKMFMLHCQGLTICSRGGAFQVTAVPGDKNKMRVLVGTERVEITDLAGNSYGYFYASEEATIDLSTRNVVRKKYNEIFVSDQSISAVLHFDRMTIEAVAAALQDQFGVKIRVAPSVRKQVISAMFPAEISLFGALEALKVSNQDKKVVYDVVTDSQGAIRSVTIDRR